MRRLMSLLAMVLPLAGCFTDGRATSDSLAVEAQSTRGDVPGATLFRALPGEGGAYDDRADIGRGVVHLTVRADSIGRVREDTMIVRAAPADNAMVVARWIHRYGLDWTWEYRLETTERGLVRNDIEWSYEESGLPVDSLTPDGAWVRVLHAVDAQGNPRRGWVRTAPDLNIEWWADVLAGQNLYFRNQDSIAAYTEPGGRRIWPDIAAGSEGPDYSMTPIGRSNHWMRVILTTPSDFCVDPPVVRSDTVWIRYLDERGRPRVWYYPRGC